MDFREKTGRVLKKIAMALFVIGIISSLFSGIFIFVTQGGLANQTSSSMYILRGIIVILAGVFGSFVCYTLVYAFGQLLENQQMLLRGPRPEFDDVEPFDHDRDHRGPRPMGFPPRPRPRPEAKKESNEINEEDQ